MRKLLLASVAVLGLAAPALANSDNDAFIEQSGNPGNNVAIQFQDGSAQTATGRQTGQGNDNRIEQTQRGGLVGARQTATATQTGTSSRNRAFQTQTFNNTGNGGNQATSLQTDGRDNVIEQTQSDRDHVAIAYQGESTSSRIFQTQTGNSNTANSFMVSQTNSLQQVNQNGTLLTATQRMESQGANNVQRITQVGTGNTAVQTVR